MSAVRAAGARVATRKGLHREVARSLCYLHEFMPGKSGQTPQPRRAAKVERP